MIINLFPKVTFQRLTTLLYALYKGRRGEGVNKKPYTILEQIWLRKMIIIITHTVHLQNMHYKQTLQLTPTICQTNEHF